MILLASTSDLVRVVTSSTATTDVHASFVDLASSTVTPGRTNTLISTATTTTVVASPAASTYRTLKTLHVRNRSSTTSQDVTVLHSDGTNIVELIKVTLSTGYALHYDEHQGFSIRDSIGRPVERLDDLTTPVLNTVVLGADVVNDNVTPDTIADVTGLSFPVVAASTYWFRFSIPYTAAATTTGSRWSVNGPGSPTTLIFSSRYSLTTTSQTNNEGLSAYDTPAASNASSAATGSNLAVIEGIIKPSASGTVIARLASEITASAITAKAGATLQWQKVI